MKDEGSWLFTVAFQSLLVPPLELTLTSPLLCAAYCGDTDRTITINKCDINGNSDDDGNGNGNGNDDGDEDESSDDNDDDDGGGDSGDYGEYDDDNDNAAKAAEIGINRKWEQCGYNSQIFCIQENCYVGYFLYVPCVPLLLAKF